MIFQWCLSQGHHERTHQDTEARGHLDLGGIQIHLYGSSGILSWAYSNLSSDPVKGEFWTSDGNARRSQGESSNT